jgi:hypothetical protein
VGLFVVTFEHTFVNWQLAKLRSVAICIWITTAS